MKSRVAVSHDRVTNVSGYLQHSVQVAEDLGRVIGGQITRRVLKKISSVTLATLFSAMGIYIVLFRLSKPSQGQAERLCLSPRQPHQCQLKETRKSLGQLKA